MKCLCCGLEHQPDSRAACGCDCGSAPRSCDRCIGRGGIRPDGTFLPSEVYEEAESERLDFMERSAER